MWYHSFPVCVTRILFVFWSEFTVIMFVTCHLFRIPEAIDHYEKSLEIKRKVRPTYQCYNLFSHLSPSSPLITAFPTYHHLSHSSPSFPLITAFPTYHHLSHLSPSFPLITTLPTYHHLSHLSLPFPLITTFPAHQYLSHLSPPIPFLPLITRFLSLFYPF